jgi:hypothetical protein
MKDRRRFAPRHHDIHQRLEEPASWVVGIFPIEFYLHGLLRPCYWHHSRRQRRASGNFHLGVDAAPSRLMGAILYVVPLPGRSSQRPPRDRQDRKPSDQHRCLGCMFSGRSCYWAIHRFATGQKTHIYGEQLIQSVAKLLICTLQGKNSAKGKETLTSCQSTPLISWHF